MAQAKLRVYDLSKELNISNKAMLSFLEKEFDLTLKSHSSSVDDRIASEALKRYKAKAEKAAQPNVALAENRLFKSPAAKPAATGGTVVRKKVVKKVVRRVVKAGSTEETTTPEISSTEIAPTPEAPAVDKDAARKAKIQADIEARQSMAHPVAKGPLPPRGKKQFAGSGIQPMNAAARSAMAIQEQKNAELREQQAKEEAERKAKEAKQDLAKASPSTNEDLLKARGAKSFFEKPLENAGFSIRAALAGRSGGNSGGSGIQARGKSRGRKANEERKAERLAAERAKIEEMKVKEVEIPGPMTVRELANLLQIKETEVIRQLFMKGVMVTVNHTLDTEAMLSVCESLEVEATVAEQEEDVVEATDVLEAAAEAPEDEDENLQPRPPVISIMGHVDHGKTSLLDAIRERRNNIVDTEAGGITQSIGAYTVQKDDQTIVFLDTPGHEAFTAMRMRGAKSTDVAILVVAADDGVMPQTKEAINHAKAAGIPIIVAVNKIDKPSADPDRVLTELMDEGLVAEKYGGDAITVEVSALKRTGIDEILEMILLVSELKPPKANPDLPAEGVVIEAQLDKRKGAVATVLVQKGTLRVGDSMLIDSVGGKIRALINEEGKRIQEAGPSMPVEVLGLDDVPHAGDLFRIEPDDKAFKNALSDAKLQAREDRLTARRKNTGGLTRSLDDINKKELRIILKSDTQGSAEAVVSSMTELNTDEVQVNVLHSGTGDVTEADVMLASASEALILTFNVKADNNALNVMQREGVSLRTFDVIYHLLETTRKLMLGQLDAEVKEVEIGKVEVRQLFTIGKRSIAGCMVTEGKVTKGAKAVITRDGKEIYTGFIDELKRFKDDVKEVAQGFECGISFSKFNELEENDLITCFVEEEYERTEL